jgi:hypothetical protein
VRLDVTIMDSNNKSITRRPDVIGAERFVVSRTADAVVAIPVAQLAPGEYLLVFEGVSGTNRVTRRLRFDVE